MTSHVHTCRFAHGGHAAHQCLFFPEVQNLNFSDFGLASPSLHEEETWKSDSAVMAAGVSWLDRTTLSLEPTRPGVFQVVLGEAMDEGHDEAHVNDTDLRFTATREIEVKVQCS